MKEIKQHFPTFGRVELHATRIGIMYIFSVKRLGECSTWNYSKFNSKMPVLSKGVD